MSSPETRTRREFLRGMARLPVIAALGGLGLSLIAKRSTGIAACPLDAGFLSSRGSCARCSQIHACLLPAAKDYRRFEKLRRRHPRKEVSSETSPAKSGETGDTRE